jgi:hypothetical protein
MDKTKGKRIGIHNEPKLSFGSALKNNVRKYLIIIFIIISLIILLHLIYIKKKYQVLEKLIKRKIQMDHQYQFQKLMKVIMQISPLIQLMVGKKLMSINSIIKIISKISQVKILLFKHQIK